MDEVNKYLFWVIQRKHAELELEAFSLQAFIMSDGIM